MWRDHHTGTLVLQWASPNQEDWENIEDDEAFGSKNRQRIYEAVKNCRPFESILVQVAGFWYRFRWAPEDYFLAALLEANTKDKSQ